MTTYWHTLKGHHSHWLLVLVVFAAVLLLVTNRAVRNATRETLSALSPGLTESPVLVVPETRAVPAHGSLPFTFRQVERYFVEALGTRPMRLGERAIVFQSGTLEPLRREEEYRITVTAHDPELHVNFAVKGDYGMQLVREFLEAPWMRTGESEHLYYLLHLGAGSRVANFDRFKVRLTVSKPREWLNVAFRFAPPDMALAMR